MLAEPGAWPFRSFIAARGDHRRRIGRDRDHSRLSGARQGPSDRALRHAGDRLPYLHPLHRRSGEGQRHHRPSGRRHGNCAFSTAPATTCPMARSAKSPRADRRSISAITTTRPPTPPRSPTTAGFAPAISAALSTPPGNVQLSGRSKEIINRGGKKFFPREVEEILYTHPNVMHAAMVGLPDARLGERNCLCVIPKSGRDLSLDEAVDFPQGPDRRLQTAGDHRTLRRIPDDRNRENTPPHPARSGAGPAQAVSGLKRWHGLNLTVYTTIDARRHNL